MFSYDLGLFKNKIFNIYRLLLAIIKSVFKKHSSVSSIKIEYFTCHLDCKKWTSSKSDI